MENTFFVDSDKLSEAALAKKHRLENDPSSRTDHMKYMEGMDRIDSDIMTKVMGEVGGFDYDSYTAIDVKRALEHEERTIEDLKAMLSPAAEPFWSRWHRRRRQRPESISAIPFTFSLLCTSPITARTIACTADSTATTT